MRGCQWGLTSGYGIHLRKVVEDALSEHPGTFSEDQVP